MGGLIGDEGPEAVRRGEGLGEVDGEVGGCQDCYRHPVCGAKRQCRGGGDDGDVKGERGGSPGLLAGSHRVGLKDEIGEGMGEEEGGEGFSHVGRVRRRQLPFEAIIRRRSHGPTVSDRSRALVSARFSACLEMPSRSANSPCVCPACSNAKAIASACAAVHLPCIGHTRSRRTPVVPIDTARRPTSPLVCPRRPISSSGVEFLGPIPVTVGRSSAAP